MTNEETLLVVVGINEPAGDAFGPVAADFAGLRIEYIDAMNLHLNLPVFRLLSSMSGSPKTTNKLPVPVFFNSSAMCKVCIHSCLQHRDATELVEFARMSLEVEGAGDKHVKARISGFAGGLDEIGPRTVPNSGPMKIAARFSVPLSPSTAPSM